MLNFAPVVQNNQYMKSLFNKFKKAVDGLTNLVENANSTTAEEVTGKLKNAVSGFVGKIESAHAASVEAKKVKPESSSVVQALEKSPIKAVPFASDKLYLTVESNDVIDEDWYVLVDINPERIKFTTAMQGDLSEKFKAAGFEAVYKYPLTMVTREVPMQELSGLKSLEKCITELVKHQGNVIEEYVKTDDYTITDLDVMLFDCEHVAKGMKKSKYFDKIDDDGDVRLTVAPTDDCMYSRFVWVMPKVDRIILDCGISDVTMPDNIEAVAKEMEEKADGIKFKVDNGKLRLKAYIDPEDYYAVDIPEKSFKTIDTTVEKLLATWVEVLKKLNMRVGSDQFFNLAELRNKFKKIPDFEKIDEDGDMKFTLPGDSSFSPERFAWILLKKDRITLNAGITGYTSQSENMIAPEEVVKKFNSSNNGFEAYVTDGAVRIRKRFNLDNYGESNPTKKVADDVINSYSKAMDAITTVAEIAGMKVKYYIPDFAVPVEVAKRRDLSYKEEKNELTIELKPTKTKDGILLTTGTLAIRVKNTSVDYELKVMLEKSCNNNETLGVANEYASSLAKAIHQRVDCQGGNYSIKVSISVPRYKLETQDDFLNIFAEALSTLYYIDSKASDLVLEALNREIREERERERRRQEEERERERRRQEEERERERRRQAEIAAARQSELNAYFTYNLRSGGTIRQLQEGFTEDYPYLRIGVYMVKTGQAADRDGGDITPYNSNTTFGEIRSFKGDCKVRIEGRSTPESLEKQFRTVSGLVIKICYNDERDRRFYISKDNSNHKKPICDLNRDFREAGYKTADIS